jgi:hypothetical protein
MTQPWNPNPYSDPSAYPSASAQAQQNAIDNAPFYNGSASSGLGAYVAPLTGTWAAPQASSPNALMPYGGYQGAFGQTRNDLLQWQNQAQNARAPQANLGQANAQIGSVNASLQGEAGAEKALKAQAAQLQGIANGGQTAANAAMAQGYQSAGAAAQSAAASAAPGAAYSAAQRGGAATQSALAASQANSQAQLNFQQKQAAMAALAQNQAAQGQVLAGQRGLATSAAGASSQLAQINPQLQEQQNQLNAETAAGYNQALLGMQATAQAQGAQADQTAANTYLGYQGIQTQQQGLAIGAATGAGGALAGQLGGAINSSSGPTPTPSYSNGIYQQPPY